MKSWKLRGCPRCSGDIFIAADEEHMWYETCLQCGYSRELKKLDVITNYANEFKKKPALVEGVLR